ncbi:MAG TPA: ABC transporter ATP-binding protein [Desulfocapsa sulfexigens]|nr:ABC transporter ATP-binding protein [Desulfocapsa sulfexigens]
MLSVSGLTKTFDQQPVFSGFTLTVTRNRFAVLIGPSGCGKSTFFDVLTGVTPADEGLISWQGSDVDHLGDLAAYMHQKDLLLPWFSLLENSLLPARTGGEDLKQARQRAIQLFSRLGLDGYEKHLPHQVSGGMRQRCALVRTLMFNRDLVLLDEPLSALDAITRKSLQSLLLLLQSEFNRTLLMITHDVDEALLLADDLYLLSVKPMRVVEKIELYDDKPRRFDNPELLAIKKTIMQKLEGDIDHVS